MGLIKRLIQKILSFFGFSLIRNRCRSYDLEMYRRLFDKNSIEKRKFYNIGAGGFRHPFWTNVDKINDAYIGVQNVNDVINFDLLKIEPLPINSDSAEIIYTSHTIEHITDTAAKNMFAESYRSLKKGGVLRITTPNIDLEYRAYKNNDRDYFYWKEWYSTKTDMVNAMINQPLKDATIQQLFLHHFAASASTLFTEGDAKRITDDELDKIFTEYDYEDALNYCISRCDSVAQNNYPSKHRNWWNKDKLFRFLTEAGFSNIYLSGYGQSYSPVLRDINYFDNTHPKISIYVEAIK